MPANGTDRGAAVADRVLHADRWRAAPGPDAPLAPDPASRRERAREAAFGRRLAAAARLAERLRMAQRQIKLAAL